MERLTCKACGCSSLLPMEVTVEGDTDYSLTDEKESHFYSCHVCGDNWLTLKETEGAGACKITFLHQMGTQPALRRVAHMTTPIVLQESTVEAWHYYVGQDEIDEDEWQDELKERRWTLRSMCVN